MHDVGGVDRNALRQLLETVFHKLIRNRQRLATPSWPGAVSWEARTREENALVKGWAVRRPADTGTVILTHGFTGNSMSPWLVEIAAHLSTTFPLSAIGFDLRFHGLSHNGIPTFGTGEMRDLTAALDWAEANGYARPYIIYGESLGAMAAARIAITDPRVRAAFLKSSPGSPYQALRVNLGGIFGGAQLINNLCGFDILTDGDIRSHNPFPKHKPFICYLTGDNDYYDIAETRKAYVHWYGGNGGRLESLPGEHSADLKWFVTARGAGHVVGAHNYSGYYDLIDRFIRRVLSEPVPAP